MKIAFDIGGVLSKDKRWRELLEILYIDTNIEIYIITDMHDRDEALAMLDNNNIVLKKNNVYCADYQKYGEACKSILLRDLGIDIFFDDFVGYLQWDSQLGPAPIRCLVMPDWNRPYWSEDWICSGEDFGRRVAPQNLKDS